VGAEPTFLLVVSASERIAEIIEPSLRAIGYELVRVTLQGKQRPTLQIMAERVDRAPMTVEHCAEISRTIAALLDVEDPLPGAYRLEVSSPGIDRPLVRPDDYRRFSGSEARLETVAPMDGRARFKGRLLGLDGLRVRIALPEGERTIPLADIKKAKLVPGDDLLGAARAKQRR
jgi:ribosome maturation factor RimP